MLTDYVIAFRTNHQARKWEHHVQLVQAYYRLTDRYAAEELTRRLMDAHIKITPRHLAVDANPKTLQVLLAYCKQPESPIRKDQDQWGWQ